MKQDLRGRPKTHEDSAVVALASHEAKTRLNQGSLRRAVVTRIIEFGGRSTIGQLNESFDFDVRRELTVLEQSGWIKIGVEDD